MIRARPTILPIFLSLMVVLVLTAVASPVRAQKAKPDGAPEGASGRTAKKPAIGKRFMVAAANPHAVRAGVEMLRAGGTAADAAIAVQLVLGLVEPQSSGLGGGAFALYWTARDKRLVTWDGRETAPRAATADLFRDPAGKLLAYRTAVRTGRAVGTPGLPALLWRLHQRHGRLPWARLFGPAIRLAEQGFAVSPRLHKLLNEADFLKRRADSRAYFFDPEGNPWPVGHRLRNPAYAAVLRLLAARGPSAFYRGVLARAIVRAVQEDRPWPGGLALTDLRTYRAKVRPAVCGDYRRWRVCGMGPPSSGGIAMIQILKLIEPFDAAKSPPEGARTAHLLIEAGALAFADRNRYVADPDHVAVPVRRLIDAGYLRRRARLIDPVRAGGKRAPGTWPARKGHLHGPGLTLAMPSTSHISIIDAAGNALSMTTTIEAAFGSGIMVAGFLLNNQLTDFSFRAMRGGQPVANRVGPGKRPRSSMAPTIVFGSDGQPVLVIGSPGGSRIIGYVARAVSAVLDHGLSLPRAFSIAHVLSRNGPAEIERGTRADTAAALGRMGHRVRPATMTSGLHGIRRLPDGRLEGAADPRREGTAIGD